MSDFYEVGEEKEEEEEEEEKVAAEASEAAEAVEEEEADPLMAAVNAQLSDYWSAIRNSFRNFK